MTTEQKQFLSLVLVLLGFGTLMVFSSSMTSRPGQIEQIHFLHHVQFLVIGLVAGGLASFVREEDWRRLAPWLLGLTVIALCLVLVPGLGARVNGATRWVRMGGLSFQPSELAKITLPLSLCAMFEKYPVLERWDRRSLGLPLIPLLSIVPLVILEPDLGTGVFLLVGGMTALFLRGWPLRNFLILGALALPLIIYVGVFKPYQVRRLTGFVAAWTDLNQAPYQLQQSLATLGSGGYWGTGLGRGWQKLSYLPEANTDFVFAVVGEELGLCGTASIVLLWLILFFVGRRMLLHGALSRFSMAWGLTLLVQIVLQAALNVAVVSALVPPKGIAHPLISRGGSNLIINLVTLGILIGLTRNRECVPVTRFQTQEC